MFPVKKVAKSVSCAGNPMDYPECRKKIADGFQSLLKRHAEGKIVLDEEFIEELTQKIEELKK